VPPEFDSGGTAAFLPAGAIDFPESSQVTQPVHTFFEKKPD
jgi:hypothetical protein